jgi:hypothetical protein
MSKGASLAPHEIRIDFAVLPATVCQGFSNRRTKSFPKGSWDAGDGVTVPVSKNSWVGKTKALLEQGFENLGLDLN